jgi:hypothetical protein
MFHRQSFFSTKKNACVDARIASQMAALAMRRLARVAERLRAGIRIPPATCPWDAPRARLFASSPPETSASARVLARDGPGLADFLRADPSGGGRCGAAGSSAVLADDATATSASGARRTAYVETYGCQMNVSDSEIVASVLRSHDYVMTDAPEDADAILVNTCAIRDGAEAKVWHRLRQLRAIKAAKARANRRAAKRAAQDVSGVFEDESGAKSKVPVVGVLGCMGERLKEKLLERDGLADLVAGPDAYRDLPRLIDAARGDEVDALAGRTPFFQRRERRRRRRRRARRRDGEKKTKRKRKRKRVARFLIRDERAALRGRDVRRHRARAQERRDAKSHRVRVHHARLR